MKKLLLFTLIIFSAQLTLHAQTIKVGAILGIPTSDAADFSDFVIGIDGYYYMSDADSFLNLGGTVGYRNYFGKDINFQGSTISVDDAQFIPVAASGRVKFLGLFSGGLDVGYAFGLTDGLDGGFYVRPVVGLINLFNLVELNLSYETITDKNTWSNINLGVLIDF